MLGLGLASVCGLVDCELGRRQPPLEMRCFASAPFSGASLIAICAFAAWAASCS